MNSFITRSNWLYKKGISVKYTTLHAIQLYKHHSLSSTVRRGLTVSDFAEGINAFNDLNLLWSSLLSVLLSSIYEQFY
jgi:hypothetical protein